MVVVLPYKPHKLQLELHNDKHRYKVISCGRRWGKTIFAINELIFAGIQTKGRYWYIAPTYRQAKMIAWEHLKHYIPVELRKDIKEHDLLIKLYTGSTIRLLGADNEDSLRGVGLQGVVFDEMADIKRNVWQAVVRPMLTDTKGWAIFLGTPKGKLNIFYEMYCRDPEHHDPAYRNIYGESIAADTDFRSWQFKTKDNPYISAEDVDKAKLEMSPQYFAQEYEASFENYTGIVYKEFTDDLIIPVQIKDWWAVYVGIDTGRHSAVSFVAVSEDKKAYVFDEIYDYDSTVATIAAAIKARLKYWNVKRPVIVIDSASQVKREYQANGIFPIDSLKDVNNSITMVRTMMEHKRLFFDNERCKMHVIEHKGYLWDDKLSGYTKQPMPKKENDHSVNATHYALNTLFLRRPEDPSKRPDENSMRWHVEQEESGVDFKDRG